MLRTFALFIVILIAVVPLTGQEEARRPRSFDRSRTEASLLEGLASENAGLQRSCALMLGHLRSDRSRFALMSILRSGPDERCRIASAWALCRIGDPSGLYLVSAMARTADSPRLRSACAWYYNNARRDHEASDRQRSRPLENDRI